MIYICIWAEETGAPRSEGPVCCDWTRSPSVGASGSEEKRERKWGLREGETGPFEQRKDDGMQTEGNEGERGSLSARERMEQSDSFNSLKVPLETQVEKERMNKDRAGQIKEKRRRKMDGLQSL